MGCGDRRDEGRSRVVVSSRVLGGTGELMLIVTEPEEDGIYLLADCRGSVSRTREREHGQLRKRGWR